MGRSCGNLKRDYEQLYWLIRQKGNVIEFYLDFPRKSGGLF